MMVSFRFADANWIFSEDLIRKEHSRHTFTVYVLSCFNCESSEATLIWYNKIQLAVLVSSLRTYNFFLFL